MTFTTTVQQIIDAARSRHFAFADVRAGDGAVLLYLNQRLRTHLARHGAKIEGLVGTTLQYTIQTINGLLVAVDSLGNPQYTTTYQDGWAVHLDAFGNPYIDTSEPMIAADPFGIHGGTPGFPLPADMIRLTAVVLVYNVPAGLLIPCTVIPEAGRLLAQPGRNPTVFVSGNRLVPLLPTNAAPSGDRWNNVSAIQLAYVALPTLSTLTQFVNIPSVLVEALIADAASYLAYQSKTLSAAERAGFATTAQACAEDIGEAALEILQEPEEETVQYRD